MRYFLLVLFSLAFISSIHAQHRSRISFNDGWKFKLDSLESYSDPNISDASWRNLNLPHDWSIEGKFDKNSKAGTGGGALNGGIGWYRKTFFIPSTQKDKSVFIEFDGVYRNSEVFINGHSLGIRPYGYISFHYDLTPYVKFRSEKNVIAVKVDNSKQPNSRWYSGSGIYRNVWLTNLNKSHVDHWGTYITTPVVDATRATIQITTKIINKGIEYPRLETIIYDENGKRIAASIATTWNSNQATQVIKLSRPKLWTLEKPHLYKAVSKLWNDQKIVDIYSTSFGIRSFYFDREKGFFLNGKPVKILGVCDHHDLGALGAAINRRALQRQLQLLKDMGCNGIRTSHNPPAPELLELADRMGFVVMDEAFDMWAKQKTDYDYHLDFNEWHEKDLDDFILRDRNHPSVFIWSIGNEIMEQRGDERKGDTSGRPLARQLVAVVKALDTTRPITTANNDVNHWNNLLQSGAFDLIGYNYSLPRWKDFLKDWPGKKLIISESNSAFELRGLYDKTPFDSITRWPRKHDIPFTGADTGLTVSAYDHITAPWGTTHEENVKELLKYDHVSGMYIWTGFDYIGEPTPYPWPARSSYFGIIDLAGFPKDVYYMYQSVFTNTPVLHLLPHWNWSKGDTVDIVAYYNNADQVELFLNGKSLGVRSKKGNDLHVKWHVPFSPGTLKAVSTKNGKLILVQEIRSAGEPYRLILKPDRTTIDADGSDLSFVEVDIVDKNGVLVPKSDNLIKFSVDGAGFIAGVDNGNPVSLEPFKGYQHTALSGKALCIIQSNSKKGPIHLTANADGLQAATLQINAK